MFLEHCCDQHNAHNESLAYMLLTHVVQVIYLPYYILVLYQSYLLGQLAGSVVFTQTLIASRKS